MLPWWREAAGGLPLTHSDTNTESPRGRGAGLLGKAPGRSPRCRAGDSSRAPPHRPAAARTFQALRGSPRRTLRQTAPIRGAAGGAAPCMGRRAPSAPYLPAVGAAALRIWRRGGSVPAVPGSGPAPPAELRPRVTGGAPGWARREPPSCRDAALGAPGRQPGSRPGVRSAVRRPGNAALSPPRCEPPLPACPARRRSELGAHAGPGMAEPEAAQPGRPPPAPGTAAAPNAGAGSGGTAPGGAGGAASSDPARPGLSQQQRASQRKAQVRGFPRGKKLEKLGVFSACKVGAGRGGEDAGGDAGLRAGGGRAILSRIRGERSALGCDGLRLLDGGWVKPLSRLLAASRAGLLRDGLSHPSCRLTMPASATAGRTPTLPPPHAWTCSSR